jgi:hypothetical protein
MPVTLVPSPPLSGYITYPATTLKSPLKTTHASATGSTQVKQVNIVPWALGFAGFTTVLGLGVLGHHQGLFAFKAEKAVSVSSHAPTSSSLTPSSIVPSPVGGHNSQKPVPPEKNGFISNVIDFAKTVKKNGVLASIVFFGASLLGGNALLTHLNTQKSLMPVDSFVCRVQDATTHSILTHHGKNVVWFFNHKSNLSVGEVSNAAKTCTAWQTYLNSQQKGAKSLSVRLPTTPATYREVESGKQVVWKPAYPMEPPFLPVAKPTVNGGRFDLTNVDWANPPAQK